MVSKYGKGSIRSASRVLASISASVGAVTAPVASVQFTRTSAIFGAGTSSTVTDCDREAVAPDLLVSRTVASSRPARRYQAGTRKFSGAL